LNGCCVGALQDKEVINICDGSRLGYICDVAVDTCTGKIVSISVPGECKLFSSPRGSLIVIPWEKIEKIGDDTILVNLPPRSECRCERPKNQKPWWKCLFE
jgi:YlmC/YmxH family sporulation protein